MASARSSRSSRSASSSGSSSHSSTRARASGSICARSRRGPPTSPARASTGSTSGRSSTTTRPATSTSCTWSGSSAQQAGQLADLIKIPPILADVAIAWLVWSMAREIGVGRAVRPHRRGARRRQPGHLVRLGPVGPGRLVRRRLPAARPPRAVARPSGAGGDLHGHRRPDQAAARDPRPDRRGRDDPAGAVAADARSRRGRGGPRAGAGPATGSGGWRAVPAWERRTDHPIRILTTGLAGLPDRGRPVLPVRPVGASSPAATASSFRSGLIEQIFKTAGGYPYASVNAYNPWALASARRDRRRRNSGWACDTLILNAARPATRRAPRR